MATKQKEEQEITEQDMADILAGTLELLRDGGLRVAAKNAPAKNGREAGVIIYVSGIEIDGTGNLTANGRTEER